MFIKYSHKNSATNHTRNIFHISEGIETPTFTIITRTQHSQGTHATNTGNTTHRPQGTQYSLNVVYSVLVLYLFPSIRQLYGDVVV